ncbi:MAG TPA: indole-3-glycerol phosphate synthase TrpC [Solirubrobacteraceae bacterium]|jgi:indole-3-glycerol phosphate synthase|nr:indole-3-glycerol phosphate synthase TrpC [Solirubrobacteraceae bacterium]
MSNALDTILEETRRRVAVRRSEVPVPVLERRARQRAQTDPPRGFAAALRRKGLSIIAEHKRRSPSAGVIREDLVLEDVVVAYERGGAAALSVLTEEASFGGSLADLRRARTASRLPILRKDFVVDPYQVTEAAAGGADAILLIVAALEPAQLAELHARAESWGLDVLVEVHDERELEVASGIPAPVIGINNRDLTTLTVDPERTFALLEKMPPGAVIVSESGWRTRDELDRLEPAGVDAVLVGEALMRSADVQAACRELAGTAPAGRRSTV